LHSTIARRGRRDGVGSGDVAKADMGALIGEQIRTVMF